MSLEELEARVSALEAEVRLIREDVAAARILAGGADRDVAALSAKIDMHKALLDALRETQIEQGQKLDALKIRLDGLESRLNGLEREMRSGFAKLAVGQSEILALLNRLISQDGA